MSTLESDPTVGREDAGLSDESTQRHADAAQVGVRERQEQERSRRWLQWVLPILTLAWLGLIAWMVVKEAIQGIQVGLVLGIPGAALLTLVGIQVSWAYGGRGKPAPGPQHLLRPREPNGR